MSEWKQEYFTDEEIELLRARKREADAKIAEAVKARGVKRSPRMVGFYERLTEQQKKAALEYDGPEDFGNPKFCGPTP